MPPRMKRVPYFMLMKVSGMMPTPKPAHTGANSVKLYDTSCETVQSNLADDMECNSFWSLLCNYVLQLLSGACAIAAFS
jgi:hypothetical protein